MKLLIAVKSCAEDMQRGAHQAIRETWGRDFKNSDLRFFIGIGDSNWILDEDEVFLLAPDDYDGLPQKTKSILKYSLEREYDYTFLCDVDTFLMPSKLMNCGFEKYDYSGRFGFTVPLGQKYIYRDNRGIVNENAYIAASGGLGYFLSKKAAEIVVQHEPDTWAEDLWVANVLGPKIATREITAAHLDEFECHISWHFRRTSRYPIFKPSMQHEAYQLGNPTLMYEKERQESKRLYQNEKKRLGQ